MKSLDIQTIQFENTVNLCNSCRYSIPECSPIFIMYGTAAGKDNICFCDMYTPLKLNKRNTKKKKEKELINWTCCGGIKISIKDKCPICGDTF